ncbi:hypothetical protein BKA83DRAFT_685883 [Pisolithus microcarpus]|nr:hypothetical protein BKA83DRAFT_685883 [Pisolithus microcarpus]
MSVENGDAIRDGGITTRPLTFALGNARVSIPVSAFGDEWIAAEVLRDDFLSQLQTSSDTADSASEGNDVLQAEVVLFARFLSFVAQRLSDDEQYTKASTSLLLNAFTQFVSKYLSDIDLFSFVSPFDGDARKTILSAFFLARATLEQQNTTAIPKPQMPALFAATSKGDASIYALFGGQGTNEVYFDELQALYDSYEPYVSPLITAITKEVLIPLAAAHSSSSFYNYGMDVISWLSGAVARPSTAYLASVPISLPLIGLTQLIQYLVICRISDLTPAQLRGYLAGTTGHSQGVVSAVAISASSTYESFDINAKKALRWLFYCGMRGQEAFPVLVLEPSIVHDSVEGGEGQPSPMLSINGLDLSALKIHINATNKHLPSNSQVSVSLYNGPRNFVVTGPPRSLYGLVTNLRKVRASSGLDQSKVPYSQRKPAFGVRFLVVNAPYHSSYMAEATDKLCNEDLGGEELWAHDELAIPVFNTEDGSDIRESTSSITRSLCDQIFTSPIHWDLATGFPEAATHVIDFGPGGLNGIGPLTARNLEGRGVRVIILGDKGRGEAELFDIDDVQYEEWWSKKYAPKLVRTSDGTVHLDTRFSRLLGKPPIMVAGMTPTTVKAGFVSAVLSAGYHIELAGGGHYNAAALRTKVAEIQSKIPEGVGITLNSLYINPKQFGFQFPLWQEMRREGLPVEGFCVAAGIPSTEKAAEIIDGLRNAGIKHVSFKPGSVEGIRQVVNIAAANPDFPIILQWTGGRAGGHHSYEDFHMPILRTYNSIRQHDNICLVGGSGFGGADDLWPYLTGDWSKVKYNTQPMPFDGFLFASRVMVAKEAHTSSSVKDLIVAAPGVDDKDWENTYVKPTGGILTVRSELGEPIHKVATRAVKLWKEFDDTVFNMPKEKRAAWLAERKSDIIEKLNKDFAKPWFGWKKGDTVALDLGDMTYEEVTLRMIRLMYVAQQDRWIDVSLRNLTGDWLRRIEERFAGVNGGMKPSILQSFAQLNTPTVFVSEFFEKYPAATEQLLAAEDRAYFLTISQRPGQKPAPFIPILDANFEVWFKKDSLWAAEDIDAVFDQDPQRVCILQGPVAVKYSTIKDEPIKDLLGNINAKLVERLLARSYAGDLDEVPTIDYLAPEPEEADVPEDVEVAGNSKRIIYKIGSDLPDVSEWLDVLSGPELNWLKALISSRTIVQGSAYIDNPLRRALRPRTGQRVVVERNNGLPVALTVYGAARSFGLHKHDFKAVEIKFSPSNLIDVTLYEDRYDVSVPLFLQFKYVPSMGSMPIHEVAETRNRRIKEFYWKLWFGDEEPLSEFGLRETFIGPEVTISGKEVETFCGVIGNQNEAYKLARANRVKAPMDFAIVTGWQAIMKAIFPPDGDACIADAKITSVKNTDAGKVVQVRGHVYRDGQRIIEVTSSFLYRGRFIDFENTFETLPNDAAVGVVQSKEWLSWEDESQPAKAGMTLVFLTFKDKTSYRDVCVAGDVFLRDQLKRLRKVGSVDFNQEGCQGNPVVAYLQRHGIPEGRLTALTNEGYTMTNNVSTDFTAPLTNEPYSIVSGDFNPIHVNPYFSDYASLPGTITHGMWSSAATRKFVENVVAEGNPARVIAYDVGFVGMIRHVGMRDGNMVVKVETLNQRGEKVIEGTAEVAQPTTVYVFTGQGSQEPGMGMDLYNSSPAARAVWDGADAHLRAVYGFSIIEIVKDNPKDKTIHFGGIKGQAIRQRYMDMTYDTMDKDGNCQDAPALLRHRRSAHLNIPSFAQIALVVTEKAAFEDMRAKGFVQKDCAFAGHSLGEYSALASMADVDVVFYRGITMQRAVERDAQNRSNYAMCAVNPSRISRTFSETALREVVDTIATRTGTLLEIVNYNVEGQQYVCAGELVALQTMTNIQKIDIAKLTETFTVEKVKEMLGDIVTESFQRAQDLQKSEGYIKLERGFATIPSSWNRYLSKKVNPTLLNPDMLVGKYIPNLVAKPFDVSKDYAQLIYDQTSSPRLDKVLKKWEQENWAAAEQRQKLAYIIPLRWIETQDLLFTEYGFERLIELGPSPVSRKRAILCHAKNAREIYYLFEDEATEAPTGEPAPAPATAAVPAPVPAAAVTPTPTTAAASIEDKLKKKIDEVPLAKSIKDLVGGKSTLQNEILGRRVVVGGSSVQLSALGKYTSGLISRMIGGKMPGGFNASAIKTYLSKSWGLGSYPRRWTWLDTIVSLYAQRSGITLTSGGAGGAAAGAGGGAVINSEEFLKFQADQNKFVAQQVELYMRYLNRDSRAGEIAYDKEKATSAQLQARLDAIAREHGDTYIDGIQPAFDPLKAASLRLLRGTGSVKTALLMYYDIIHGRLTTVDRELTARCIALLNRADPELLTYMQYHIDRCDPSKGDTYALAKQEVVGQPPVYKDVTFPTAPRTEVTAKGDIVYSENVRKLEAYVEEMASGDTISTVNIQKVQEDVLKLWTVVNQDQKNRIKALYEGVVRSLRKGPDQPRQRTRDRRSSSQFLRPQVSTITSVSADKVPLLHLKRKVGNNWEYSSNLTGVYLDILHEIATSGTTFKDKNALLTGVGKGSIGVEILKGLLSGGAHVVITTSRYSRSTVEYYQDIYQRFGARGFSTHCWLQAGCRGAQWARNRWSGRQIGTCSPYYARQLTAYLGCCQDQKASRQFVTRPTQVILPLSPNHGLFGNDGLYSESKISLETLFDRWNSESWGEYLCLAWRCDWVRNSWTRGTGLMDATNIVAQDVESYGVRTFSAKEMAFQHPRITQVEPIWADLNGGMDRLPDLADITTRIRMDLNKKSELRRAIARDNALDFKVINGAEGERVLQTVNVVPRANFKLDFPALEPPSAFEELSKLRGLVDLEKVVVITGFAEVGPWGSSRTRWEMEARGEFTIEGCIEMAWIMGFIKHFDGRLKDGTLHVGWVDAKTSEPVDDKDVRSRYEKEILAHAGVRLIEPELFRGYDPKKKVFNQEIELIHDLEPIEVARSEAEKFKHEHGEKCDIWAGEGDQWFVKFKKGARVFVPKAFRFSRLVAGQIPTGWHAGRYGIPADIIAQTDRATLWALVCTAEALNMSGITDPYELYNHMHPSEVGTCVGSGMGGTESLAKMFKDRRDEKEVQNDILQETFINTTAGWINLLLMSSSGPVKIPVGACATALQSLEIACDTILSNKAKVMVAGGFDDISEEATSNAETEFAMGREPTEMSRPATTTRAGFMESQGTGIHIVMSAKTALELGAPIRGILAYTFNINAGRSIPAPGRGALTIARELPSKYPLPSLSVDYRSRQITFRRKQISEWLSHEHAQLRAEIDALKAENSAVDEDYFATRVADIEKEAHRQEKEVLSTYGMLEGSDPRVAPMRRALAVWGLTADDIGVLSIHGTSTGANEKNETELWHNSLHTMGRTHGNAVPVMAQKSLLGHSKGGSAAWQMAGLLQTVNTGIIPGNRNSDNVDARFEAHHNLMFPSRSIYTDGIRAGVMSSFGFGQVGGTAVVVHPRYLFAALEPSAYESYRVRNRSRAQEAYKVMTEMMTTNSLVRIKDGPPYSPELERAVLLNPMARATFDPKTRSYSYTTNLNKNIPFDTANAKTVANALASNPTAAGVGVDQELIMSVPSWNSTFVERNFTDAEIAYCRSQPSPQASFAGRWVGKEAVFKSLGVASKGAATAMKDIEILPNESGVPTVTLRGDAKAAAESRGISQVLVSLSHSETVAIAFAQSS